MSMHDLSIYIHIPFCIQKCHYCDFLSFPPKEAKIISRYFSALYKEIKNVSKSIESYCIVRTIFIGGGTPTCVESQFIAKALELIRENYNVDPKAEITIESNPATFNIKKLQEYRRAGVNRLSIGLQCWQDDLLKSIGRIHTHKDFIKAFHESKEAGFNNINVDLIFDLPHQTIKDWKDSLENVCKLNPSHISCYSLILEEGTSMYAQYEAGEIELDDEANRKMYHQARSLLKSDGYIQYEISNFAKESKECKHNLVYWELKDYIGFGLGAHSFYKNCRYKNEEVLEKYIYNLERGNNIVIDKTLCTTVQLKEEFIFLGLRKIDGIEDSVYHELFDCSVFDDYSEVIEKLSKDKYIVVNGNNIRLSRQGLDFANHVFMNFLK